MGITYDEVKEATVDAAFMNWVVNTDAVYENYTHAFKAFESQARHTKTGVVLAPPAQPVIAPMPQALQNMEKAK